MSDFWKIIFIFLLGYIFISACAAFIPIEKYQQSYFNLVKEVRNKPLEYYKRQIEYADYIEQYGELPPQSRRKKLIINNKNTKSAPVEIKEPENIPLKPKYIRDKNNPEILHPYKERKFLFFRILQIL